MLSNKIKMIMTLKNKKQQELIEPLNLSTKQSISNKFKKDSFSVQDLITICDFCDCEIEIKDKNTKKTIFSFDLSDIE